MESQVPGRFTEKSAQSQFLPGFWGFMPSRIPDWGPHPEVMAAELWASLAEPDDTSPEPLLPSSSCRIPFLVGSTGRDEFQDAGL